MAVAAAIIGGAAIAAAAGVAGSKMSSDATGNAADRAAAAAAEATRMQVEESRAAREAQQEAIQPGLDRQNRAGREYENALGVGRATERNADGSYRDPNLGTEKMGRDSARETEQGRAAYEDTLTSQTSAQDEAVRRAADQRLYDGVDQDSAVQQARNNQLAGPTLQSDVGYADVAGRQLAANSLGADERFQFARDTAVVGDSFQQSPGYDFAVEQGMKEVDRRNSRGGANYGGRALMEAQRRAVGEANQEYYNWVGARQADLGRQDQAAAAYQGREAFDASRLDQATLDYLKRQGIDIGRADAAVGDARRREEMDMQRGDRALEGWYNRRTYDQSRQDAAIQDNQARRTYDQQRQDQAYYNHMNALAGASGAGQNYTGMAVNSIGQSAGMNAQAYGQQGASLANIYQNQGANQAAAYGSGAASVNNAVQGGISNALLYKYIGG